MYSAAADGRRVFCSVVAGTVVAGGVVVGRVVGWHWRASSFASVFRIWEPKCEDTGGSKLLPVAHGVVGWHWSASSFASVFRIWELKCEDTGGSKLLPVAHGVVVGTVKAGKMNVVVAWSDQQTPLA